MKKIFIIISLFLLSLSNIFAYEISYKYDDLKWIKKNDFAIIIYENENWTFEFKGKKYNPKFAIQFLEDFNFWKTKVKIDNIFFENFLKNDTKLRNYFLIRIDDSKNIYTIKIEYKTNFEDFKKLTKQEFLKTIENDDINEIWLSSFSNSIFIKDFLKQKNIKIKYLFDEIWIDNEILDFFKEKLDRDIFVNNIFLKLLENEIYNNWENINLLLN